MKIIRYSEFINESNSEIDDNFGKISEIISNECSDFLKLIREKGIKPLYRGSNIKESPIIEGFWKKNARRDRMPRETYPWIHMIIDGLLEKKFGLKIRSNGVFVSPLKSIATGYGKFRITKYGSHTCSHIFIPANGFRYFWNPKIEDLFVDIKDRSWYEKDPNLWSKKELDEVKEICDGYKEGGIEEVEWQELTFVCDNYYMLDLDYYDRFIELCSN